MSAAHLSYKFGPLIESVPGTGGTASVLLLGRVSLPRPLLLLLDPLRTLAASAPPRGMFATLAGAEVGGTLALGSGAALASRPMIKLVTFAVFVVVVVVVPAAVLPLATVFSLTTLAVSLGSSWLLVFPSLSFQMLPFLLTLPPLP